ncbi:MAG: hypothetical protein A2Y40_06600 [Candidatus Margulisbacteria bacterium GWF2_35_9]|nr:MAG: hypothetical protein A2Y40_06600 [Candidatus Margulisbacteria bacterium GWF2_35_9]
MNNYQLSKPYLIIVGASGFLGTKLSTHLMKNYQLVLFYNNHKINELLEEPSHNHEIIKVDITDYEQVKKVFCELNEKRIFINNMVFCASSKINRRNIIEKDNRDWNNTIDVNIKGLFYCTKEFLKQVDFEEMSRIIILSSSSAFGGMPYLSDYAAAKAAQIGMAKSLAMEYGDKNVLINVIAPGLISENERDIDINDPVIKERISKSPLKRLTNLNDIINIINYFLGLETNSLTGQVITLDSGNDLRYRYLLD